MRPMLALFLIISFSSLVNRSREVTTLRLRIFLLSILLRLNVYPLLGSGWGSNSKYATLGALRAAAQTISYEISLAFILIRFIVFWDGARLRGGVVHHELNMLLLPLLMILSPWIITCVAELNRTPFDFAEGESELVSGFNVEYGSVKFAMIFIAEYGIIYILSIITIYIFLLPSMGHHRVGGALSILLIFFIVLLRATLPRFRYDLLIRVAWKTLLPIAMSARYLFLVLFILVS